MVKFKKGDKVFMIRSWDDKGTFYIRSLTIESWGKKRATATEDGNFIKHAIQVSTVNQSYRGYGTFIYPDTIDAEAVALEHARNFIAEQIRFIEENRLGNDSYDQDLMKAQIEKLKATVPAVKKN